MFVPKRYNILTKQIRKGWKAMSNEKDTGGLAEEIVQDEKNNKENIEQEKQEAATADSQEQENPLADDAAEKNDAEGTPAQDEKEDDESAGEKETDTEKNVSIENMEQDNSENVNEAEAAEKPKRRGRPSKKDMTEKEIFEKRRVYAADSETRKELYAEPESIVPTLNPGIVVTESTQKREEYNYLVRAARSLPYPKILTGRITGVDKTENMNTWVAHVSVDAEEMKNGYYQIIIPASHLIPGINEKLSEAESEELGRIMIARIGSTIDFVVYQVDEKEQIAVASRLRAMEILTYLNYVRPQRGDDIPNIFVGKIVQARITEVREFGLSIEVSGAECFIVPKELSYTTLESVTNEFQVGQVVNAKVLSIEDYEVVVNDKKFKLKKIEASVKQAGRNPQEVFLHQFKEHGTYEGKIKRITEKGIFVVLNDKVDCLCFVPRMGTPERGKRCVVIVDKIDTEQNRLSGRILRMDS